MSKKRKLNVQTRYSFDRRSSSTSSSAVLREDFNPDYTYVIKDLRRIGILAGSFLVILVILSFFLG